MSHASRLLALLGSLTVIALVPAAASAQTVSFASPAWLSTGASADGVAIADFTGNGAADIAVVDPGGDVIVYVPNGGGGYTADGPFSVGGSPQAIAVADFNGDGKPDIVTANDQGTDVSVLINTTTSGSNTVSFATAQDFTVGSEPDAIAIADFNGDGKPDIATANYGSSNVSVLLNTTTKDATTASFATAVNSTVQAEPIAIASGDLNGDGRADIVTASMFGSPSLSVLLSTTDSDAGTASFRSAQTITSVNGAPTELAIGDLGGADEPDLVVGYNNLSDVGVLADTTTSDADSVTFAAEQDFPTVDPNPGGLALTDMNGDGKLDIVDASNAGNVSVLVNATPSGGALSFGMQSFATAEVALNGLAVGDLDGDGRPDIVTSFGGGTSDNVGLLLNQTTSLATSAPSTATLGRPLTDTARLTAGSDSGGTIRFDAYGPKDATCTGKPAFVSRRVTVNGSGRYRSRSFTPSKPGVYRWIAKYSGDAGDAAAATSCGEPVTVSRPRIGRVELVQVRASATKLIVRLRCAGSGGAVCHAKLTLTARGGTGQHAHGKGSTRDASVVIGRAAADIAVKHTATVTVNLNAAGKRLLSERRRLVASLHVVQRQRSLRRTIAFTATRGG